jgi:choline dehydrogenase
LGFANFLLGPFTVVNATKEIIVSCGPIGTPHLLQLSGIGDPQKLSAAGIDTVIANPHVGINMTDHA